MTQTVVNAPLGTLEQLLLGGLAELDITRDEHERAVQRYAQLGAVLDAEWAATRGRNAVFAQGSFMLGTVVRNVNHNDDIDIDVVARRDVAKSSITQEELKAEVGHAARMLARRADGGAPTVEESSRCWTLTWPGMHMDILPTIPDTDVGGDGLLITDKEVRQWLPSNPVGYASWFQARSSLGLPAERAALEKRALDIHAVPQWRQRTVLQRTVQALKRHRDVYFAGRLGDRPASIVITTLTGQAYAGAGNVRDALRQVTADMAGFLEYVDGRWVLRNPAQPEENFADGWAAAPECARYFFEWLTAARAAFSALEAKSGLHEALPALEASFGARFAKGASRALADSLGSARNDGGLRLQSGGTIGSAAAATAGLARTVRSHGFAGGPTA